jgi:hypothetical protein
MPSSEPGRRAEYYMTQLDAFVLAGRREQFVEAAAAFRNLRELAHRRLASLVLVANARARQPNGDALAEADIAVSGTDFTQSEEENQDVAAGGPEVETPDSTAKSPLVRMRPTRP